MPTPVFHLTPKPVISLAPMTPAPAASAALLPNFANAKRMVVRRIPRSRLAPLPPMTRANTFTMDDIRSGRRHPLTATGNTVNLVPLCATAGGAYVLPNPCQVYWDSSFGTGVVNGSDTLEDIYFSPADPTTGNSTGTYNPPDAYNALNMNVNGVWVLGTYDDTSNAWLDVAYIQIGSTAELQTYSDNFDTVPAQSFTGGSTVYFSDGGLQGADDYAYYIESTSVNPSCVFVFPAPAATPGPGLCNPDTAVARTPASGTFSGYWNIPASEPTGTYSLVLYDTTANERVAQIQFSVVTSGATGAISMEGVPGASGTAAPSAAPAPPTPAAIFAFDSTSENSDKGVTASVSGLTSGHNYRETVSDPDGMVVYSNDITAAGTTATVNWTFTNTQSPNNYTGQVYTMSLYDLAGASGALGATPNPSDVVASEAFQIVGYNVETTFTSPAGTAITLTGSALVSGLEFNNNGSSNYYSAENSDPIARLYFNTAANGITATLGSGSTSCGTGCQTQVIVDSNGVQWTIVDQCYGGGANAGCTITGVPVTAGQSLAVGATLTIPSITWNAPPGNSKCAAGCTGVTSVLPYDGADWSSTSQTAATNNVYFNNGNVNSYTATGHFYFIGYNTNGFGGGALNLGPDIHGFTPRSEVVPTPPAVMQGTYAYNEPGSSANANYADVYDLHINNTSSGGSPISEIEWTYPTGFGGNSTYVAVDPSSPTAWTFVTCPTGTPSNALCLDVNTGAGNNGVAYGTSEDLYIDLIPGPYQSFAYTDNTFQVLDLGTGGAKTSTIFGISPDGTNTVFVGQTNPETIDSTASAAYSLDDTLMTGSFAPASVGSPSNDTVTVALTNSSTTGTFPDEIDAIAVDLPSAYGWNTPTVTAPSAGWSYLGSWTSGGTTRYYFGLCSSQFPSAFSGSWNPSTGDLMPSCGAATEQSYAIQPSKTFNASGVLNVGSGVTGPINGTIWVHGANGDGWNTGKAISMAISPIGATAGFSAIYPYGGAVVPITAPNLPTVGADSNPTYGNSYQYTVTNTGSATGMCGSIPCNSITQVTVTLPGTDINGVNGTDSTGINWQITPAGAPTATVTITGSQSGGKTCTATVVNPTTGGANGSITINGGTGCYIAPGDAMVISFSAQAPYKVNSIFNFPATFNSGTNASEAWNNDTEVEIVANATLVIVVDPGIGPGAYPSHPVPNCAQCTFGSNLVDFNAVANNTAVTGTDLATVSVYTNVGSPAGWGLYVSTNNNPTNSTGSPTNELLTAVDSSTSSQGMGLSWDTTSETVIPTSGSGIEVANAPTTVSATRSPFDLVQSYEISIGAEPIAPETSTVTYTWIEN